MLSRGAKAPAIDLVNCDSMHVTMNRLTYRAFACVCQVVLAFVALWLCKCWSKLNTQAHKVSMAQNSSPCIVPTFGCNENNGEHLLRAMSVALQIVIAGEWGSLDFLDYMEVERYRVLQCVSLASLCYTLQSRWSHDCARSYQRKR